MNPLTTPDLVKTVAAGARYAKGRDSMFTALLLGGVWLASDIRHTADEIKRDLATLTASSAKLELRVASLEQKR